MGPGKFDSTVDKDAEDELTEDRPEIEHLHEPSMDPVSQPFEMSDRLHTVEDDAGIPLLQSAMHLINLEEEKHKHSWTELLKARLKSFCGSPIFLASMSSLTLTINNFIVKILAREYSVFQIVSIRAIVGLAIIWCVMFWKGIFPLGPRNKVPPLVLRGILGAIAMGSSWLALSLLPLSEAAFLRNSYPIVTAVLASITGMETLNWKTWLGVGGTAIGNAFVAHPPFIFGGHQDWGTRRGVGLALSTVCVLAMGSNFIIVKRIGKNVHPFVHSTYQLSCSVLIAVPFLSASYPKEIKAPAGLRDSCLFGIVGLGSVTTQALMVTALQRGSPTLVTAVMMTNMIYASFVGVFALSERFSWMSGSGACIILISVLLVVVGRGLSKKQEHEPLPQNEEANELEPDLVLPNDFNESTQAVDEEPK